MSILNRITDLSGNALLAELSLYKSHAKVKQYREYFGRISSSDMPSISITGGVYIAKTSLSMIGDPAKILVTIRIKPQANDSIQTEHSDTRDKKARCEVSLFKVHNKVTQFREKDSTNGVVVGAIYIANDKLATLGNSAKELEITLQEFG